MSKIRLFGTSSGYVEIAPAATASNNTLTAPRTVGEIIAKDAAGAIGITSMKASNVNVGAAVTITESGIEASGIGITCANINGTQIGGKRNLVINGAMQVAQRGTSSTSTGYQTVDRFKPDEGGVDEATTKAQVDVASGTTPYTLGFRKALKITNGNQTSGAGAADFAQIDYRFEAQDIAKSGWNYTSSSSFITLSFWIKSSVSKDFQITLKSFDGTSQSFQFETPTLSADTWTKVTKTIPGDSNLTFDDNADYGLILFFFPYIGTDYTSGSNTLNDWVASSSSTYGVVDGTSWWTTNDATYEITGVQLEVGSQATPFEHRSFGEELALCQRYTYMIKGDLDDYTGFSAYSTSTTAAMIPVFFPVTMRAAPSFTFSGTARFQGASNDSANFTSGLAIISPNTNFTGAVIQLTGTSGLGAADRPGNLQFRASDSSLLFSAEL